MKKLLIAVLALCLLAPTAAIWAQNKKAGQSDVQVGVQVKQNNGNGNGNANGSANTDNGSNNADDNSNSQGNANVQQGQQGNSVASQAQQNRQSKFENAIQQMQQIATKNQGQAQQLQVKTQEQEQLNLQVEQSLQKSQARNSLARFFIGANYSELKKAKDNLAQNETILQELQQVSQEITSPQDQQAIDAQIQVLQDVQAELEAEIQMEEQGFSLFGWLNKILSKY